MLSSPIIYLVLGIFILIGIGYAFRGINSGTIAKETTKQEQEDTKQTTVKNETKEDVVKARLATRREQRWWRFWRRRNDTPPPPLAPLPQLDPKPNRPLGN